MRYAGLAVLSAPFAKMMIVIPGPGVAPYTHMKCARARACDISIPNTVSIKLCVRDPVFALCDTSLTENLQPPLLLPCGAVCVRMCVLRMAQRRQRLRMGSAIPQRRIFANTKYIIYYMYSTCSIFADASCVLEYSRRVDVCLGDALRTCVFGT